MPVNFAMSAMTATEFLLWAFVGFFFWKRNLQQRFPAMSAYLILRFSSMPILLALLHLQARQDGNEVAFFKVYFYVYWAVYLASAIFLYFICIEVFRAALSPYAGLMRLGTVVFRWATLVSLIVCFSSVSFTGRGPLIVSDVAYALMRSVSLLELCLLAFLCLSMNALNLSVRDIPFGIALGFGLMSADDFLVGSLLAHNHSLISSLQFLNESLILVSLGIWIAYVLLPERVRKPVVLAPSSAIYRWNEIAAALGHGTKVAVQQPANSFFLSDVEKVVDKVLTRSKLQGNETK